MACLEGVLVVNPERVRIGESTFTNAGAAGWYRDDYREPGPADAADALDEVVRLRTTIAQAIADLGPHTMVHNYDSGDECDDCCDDWPCRYARVADDLRKAIEP